MIRRGFLRGLGGLMAIAPSVKPTNAINSVTATYHATTGAAIKVDNGDELSGASTGGIFGSEENKAKWRLFSNRSAATKRRMRRTARMLALTGGWPPGVACMESNALWFRAHVAEKWIERKAEEEKSLMDSIHESIYGEKYYD